MSDTPANALWTPGRTRPCVSEMRPMTTGVSLGIDAAARRRVAPPCAQPVLHVQVVEHAGDDEIDEVIDARWRVIESRRGRHHDGAGAGHAQHVLEVDHAQRRLPRYEEQR